MDFTNLLRAVDSQHDAYQGRIIELFDQYRGWVIEAANDKREALLANDADYIQAHENAEHVFNAAILASESEDDLVFAAARQAFDETEARIVANREATAALINRQNAARDARSYEWLCVQLQIAKHDFNIKLIDSITEFAA